MMAEPKEPTLTYRLRTWDHYPRAKYFQKLLLKLHPRFNRTIESFPDSLQYLENLKQISDDVRTFTVPPELIVLGNTHFPLLEMVVKSSEGMLSRKPVVGRGPKVVVCYVNVERLDENFRKTLSTRLQECLTLVGNNYQRLLVFCNIRSESTAVTCESLSTFIQETIKCIQHENIVVHYESDDASDEMVDDHASMSSANENILGAKIDNALELSITEIYDRMSWYLDRFIASPASNGKSPKSMQEREVIMDALVGFLGNAAITLELKEIPQENKSSESLIVSAISRCIKCNYVPVLAQQYSLQEWVCNGLLEEENFETNVKDALSTKTRKQLIGITKDTKPAKKTLVESRSGFVLSDVDSVLKTLSGTMETAQHVVSVMKKMKYEIQTYFKHSILSASLPNLENRRVTESLRRDILCIEEVFGVGQVFGELEVHLETKTEDAVSGIQGILSKHQYHYPYRILEVSKEPKLFADMLHDNGKLIQAHFPDSTRRTGTLGAFFIQEGNAEELYALTCGHVVKDGIDSIAHSVLIEDTGGKHVLLGSAADDMTVNGIIDIAAIRVDNQIKQRCHRPLKDDSGLSRRARIVDLSPAVIAEEVGFPYVYKYGGRSRLTFGIIAAPAFQYRAKEQSMTDCQLILEPQPDVSASHFAVPGDSGAIVCTSVPGTDEIPILSILTGGEYMIVGDPIPKCMSFMLTRGLQAIEVISHRRLVLPY